MKLVVQVKLLPTPEQAAALAATLSDCNAAADLASAVGFARFGLGVRLVPLHHAVYRELRNRGLGAQATVRTMKKVVDAYTTLRAGIDARRFGKRDSPRRTEAQSKPIRFRSDAAQPFEDRNLSWRHEARRVSIWTVHGRITIAYTGSPTQLATLAEHRKGESDLIHRNGRWLLAATCEVPEAALNTEPRDWIGVDRGIANLAVTSDSRTMQGKGLQRYRRRMARVRAELQTKGTKSAKRKLKRRARREARHTTCVNHTIAKTVVADAERTGRGIALEDLTGIRERTRVPRHQRATISSWPFHQLARHIGYKARRAGVPVIEVDAHYTSQTCPRCGHVAKKNRPTRDTFRCVACGLAGPADHIAAVNVQRRARTAWVFVNMPHAAASPSSPSGTVASRKPGLSESGR